MIAVIDYNAGNTRSVMNALERLDATYILTDDIERIRNADKVIFPGVGHAKAAMNSLIDKGLDQCIGSLKQPVLGICIGMQLLCAHSEEGSIEGLNLMPLEVKRFPGDQRLKVPHMGWNSIIHHDHPLFEGVMQNAHVYFVHSYFVPRSSYSIAECEYGLPFSAAIQCDNYYGLQFHTEKSGRVGERILSNFIFNI